MRRKAWERRKGGGVEREVFIGMERERRGRHSVALRCDVIRLSGTLTSRHTTRCKADEDIMLVYSSCFPSSRELLEPKQRLGIAHLSLFHPSLLSPHRHTYSTSLRSNHISVTASANNVDNN